MSTKQLKETKTFGYDIIKNATNVLAAAWLKAKPSSICHVCDPPEASSQWGTLTEMNRLQEVKSDKKLLQRNTYDAEGLRTEMEENNRLIKFLYDGDKVIAESDTSKGLQRFIRGYVLRGWIKPVCVLSQ